MSKVVLYNFKNKSGEICFKEVKDKEIIFKENGRKFTGYNPELKEIIKVKIDGCMIKDGIKCDGLIVELDKHYGYFIELKGSNLNHAIKQLKATIEYVDNVSNGYISKKFVKKFAFAVLSKYSLPSASAQRQNIELTFKKLGIQLKISNNHFIYDLQKEKVIDKIN